MNERERLTALVQEFVKAVKADQSNEQELGIVWFDSYRGPYCPTCGTFWSDDAKRHLHLSGCPFRRLLAEIGR